MEKKLKSKVRRILFTLNENERREITLSSRYAETIFLEFKELVKLLSDSERFGTRLSVRDSLRVESLPFELRKKLIGKGLLKAKLDEKIPTLLRLIEQYKESRSGISVDACNRDKRLFNYLIEYFGKDKRIDLITPAEASGIRNYLMNKRKAGRGKLCKSSTNKVVIALKPIFNFAVDCGYLQNSPFAKVKGGPTTSPERVYYVTYEEIEKAIRVCGDDVELAGILAFARYAGLRIPSEIRDLRFTSFSASCFSTGDVIFQVPTSGKTGTRRVPFFAELIPYLKAIREKSKPEQEFVFEKYRNCKNVGTLIKKKMRKAGLNIWEKFFINQRSSCQTDKERLGWSRSVMDAAFGNSEHVRLIHYIQPMPDNDYAKLGQVENGKSLDTIEFFKQIPTEFPTFEELFDGKLTYSDVLAGMGCDAKARQKVFDCIMADPDLSVCYTSVSAFLEMVNGKQVWELPEEEQIKRANTLVQSAAQHFEKSLRDFNNPLERSGTTGHALQ
ncbi:MAG: phage integrase SAM-like domain-containing protein [Planctomycetaceae bacterium]|jgi:integrase|nr:phage integrase SAM-like domain-containing protein [Planctomycetaceae bacterium]